MNRLERFILNMVYYKQNFVVNFDAKGGYRYHRREQYLYRITQQGIDKMEEIKSLQEQSL